MPGPLIWSVSGLDSSGVVELSADQRAADAAGVRLAPAAAALVTSQGDAVPQAVPPEHLDARLRTLAAGAPPAAIKAGLLGSVANVRVLADWVDRLRARAPVALVVDPVLHACAGSDADHAALVAAYRTELLPRADVITPNRREAAALLGTAEGHRPMAAQTRTLQALGASALCITGGHAEGEALASDWWTSPHATGWLALPRRAARNRHGAGACFASALAAGLARGFVAADAGVLAKMLTTSGLRDEWPAGPAHAGPVQPGSGFIGNAGLLPMLVDGDATPRWAPASRARAGALEGVYGITDTAGHAVALIAAGLRTVQLRLKRGAAEAEIDWRHRLRAQIAQALTAARGAGATLVVNDHWREALALGADFVHLGQEDLLALDGADRADFERAIHGRLRLGLSSHSLWELARAAAWQPDYVACGPVWPTLTKAMPWRPQGLDNLAWWVAMAPAPVVAIGGVLTPPQLADTAATGAAAGCVVRGLQPGSGHPLSAWQAAWQAGAAAWQPNAAVGWPHPSLVTGERTRPLLDGGDGVTP